MLAKFFEKLIRDGLGLLVAREAEVFVLGQDAFEFRLVFLDGLHRLLERLGDVLLLREIQQVVVAGMVGQIEPALLDGDLRNLFLAPRAFELLVFGEDFGLVAAVVVVGEFEKDQPEHWRGILAGLEIGVGAQIISGTPEVGFELFQLVASHAGRERLET